MNSNTESLQYNSLYSCIDTKHNSNTSNTNGTFIKMNYYGIDIIIEYKDDELINGENNKIIINYPKLKMNQKVIHGKSINKKRVTFSDKNNVYYHYKNNSIWDISSDEDTSDEEDWSRY